MACRLTHIVDEETREDEVRLLSLLLASLPRDRVEQRVVVVGSRPATLTVPADVEIDRVRRRCRCPIGWAPRLVRRLAADRPDAVYAWGTVAAAGVAAHCPRWPAVAVLSDPADAARYGQWQRRTRRGATPMALLCTSKTVQGRLTDAGVPIAQTVVVPPGVDLEAIRQARKTIRRADIGLPAGARVLLTASPPSRVGGQYYAIWAAAMLRQIWPDVRMIVPGCSKEQRRLRRFVERIYCPEVYHLTGDRYTPAELLAVSDMLVVPALGDIAAGWLAWAMAASVPIVASNVPSMTEWIADRHNGFLCKPADPHALALCIRTAADAGDALARCTETARNQELEAFGVTRCVQEHLAVIASALAHRPGHGLE